MSRRALVIGAGGFLGSHLSRRLVEEGWDVTGVVRDPQEPHVQVRLGPAIEAIRIVAGTASDAELLGREVAGVDAVFPFAGRSGAARSMREPFDALASNATGQLLLLE